MSLRVDLILDSEQRSGSLLSPKSLVRIASIVGPAILLVLVAAFVMQMFQLNSKVALLEGQWEDVGGQQQTAENLRGQLLENREMLDEIGGWRESHIDWHEQLSGLIRVVPPEIELRKLRIGQQLDVLEKNMPARTFSMTLNGRAVGAGAEGAVEALKLSLQTAPAFATNVAEDGVSVPSYGADVSAGAGKHDRVFTIVSKYTPRKFDGEAARRKK
jgi:hypothetical protein